MHLCLTNVMQLQIYSQGMLLPKMEVAILNSITSRKFQAISKSTYQVQPRSKAVCGGVLNACFKMKSWYTVITRYTVITLEVDLIDHIFSINIKWVFKLNLCSIWKQVQQVGIWNDYAQIIKFVKMNIFD